jgi:hypothetical protein
MTGKACHFEFPIRCSILDTFKEFAVGRAELGALHPKDGCIESNPTRENDHLRGILPWGIVHTDEVIE